MIFGPCPVLPVYVRGVPELAFGLEALMIVTWVSIEDYFGADAENALAK